MDTETRILDRSKQGVVRIVLLLAIAALVLPACSSAEAAVPVPTVTEVPAPTATPQPAPTPIPLKDTTEPSPTPTEEPPYHVVEVPYADPDTDKDLIYLSRWLKLYLPTETAAPYPTVVLLPGMLYQPDRYQSLTDGLLDRGYAVAEVKMSICPEDSKCALAWLVSNADAHGLDSEAIFVFGHLSGAFNAVSLPLNDVAMWESLTTECHHPLPDVAAVRGIITYDAIFGVPQGSLRQFSAQMGALGVSGGQIRQALEVLESVPPREWPTSVELDDSAREVAKTVPLYWAHIAGHNGAVSPDFLIIYDADLSFRGFDFGAESEVMASTLQEAGFNAELMLMEDSTYSSLVDPNTDTPARIAEVIDTFIKEKTK